MEPSGPAPLTEPSGPVPLAEPLGVAPLMEPSGPTPLIESEGHALAEPEGSAPWRSEVVFSPTQPTQPEVIDLTNEIIDLTKED